MSFLTFIEKYEIWHNNTFFYIWPNSFLNFKALDFIIIHKTISFFGCEVLEQLYWVLWNTDYTPLNFLETELRWYFLVAISIFMFLLFLLLTLAKLKRFMKVRIKPKIWKRVFIFSWLYLKNNFKTNSIFILPLFPRYPIVLSDINNHILSSVHHHQVYYS